ncbi:hypothetical protein HK096_003204, partial [Nowakowskiella sp. JEL0078]
MATKALQPQTEPHPSQGQTQQHLSGITIRKQPVPSDVNDESVYKLIPEHVISPQKQSMYRSKFAKQAHDEYFSGTKPAASMGPPKVVVNNPADFVKRGDRERNMPK